MDANYGLRRAPKKAYTFAALSQIAQAQLRNGWSDFEADEGDEGDSKQFCHASLHYELGNEKGHIKGATGKDHGHAEMDALHVFFVQNCQKKVEKFRSYTLAVQCESKPCCVHCSAVLGLLEIRPFNNKTLKEKGSAGVWFVSGDVRTLLEGVTGAPAAAFEQLGDLGL